MPTYGAGSGVRLNEHQLDVMQLFMENDRAWCFEDSNVPTFIQVGAHDGKTVDPIRPYICRYGWDGLFIEPQPDVFERLKANYSGAEWQKRGFRFENCAISDGLRGTIKMYRHVKEAGYFSSTLCSTSARAIMCNGHNVSAEIEEITVPSMGMAEVCKKHGIIRVDYLFTDTEGCDELVVRQTIEAGFRPRLIRYENWGHKRFEDAIFPFLIDAGYSFAQVDIDIICIQQDKWAQAALRRDIPVEKAASTPW